MLALFVFLAGILAPLATPLESTRWVLVDLRGSTVMADSGKAVANITLTPNGHTVSGSSGCNVVSGTYALSGKNGLKFKVTGQTLMVNGGVV